MAKRKLWAVMLAGGSGARFWPASRRALPKQFLRIAGKRTLLQDTAARLDTLVPPAQRIVVTLAEHAALVRKQLPKLPRKNVLAEPVGRNTAASVAWAAIEIARRDPESVMLVLPSDHVVGPAAAFRKLLRAAAEEAGESGALVTLGVLPRYAATGYGWIALGPEVARRGGTSVLDVQAFVEKPDRERAERMYAHGGHLWNSGMFAWRTSAILDALRTHAPHVLAPLERKRSAKGIAATYAALPAVSIDVAVMERARGVRVLPLDMSWSDVGTWPALAEVHTADPAGNVATGGATVAAEDAQGNIVHAPRGELVALLGVRDLVVVRSGNALLVCPRSRAQDVRQLVERLGTGSPAWT